MPTWTDPKRSKSIMVRRLHEWWLSRRGDADIPDRSQLDPAEIKDLLPNLLIAEVEHEPFRIRYRLVGSRVVEVTGFDITGRYVDELLSAEPDQPWMEHYRRAYRERRPLLGATTVRASDGSHFTYEFGIFPLRKGGRSVEQFVAVEDYFNLRTTLLQLEPWRAKPAP